MTTPDASIARMVVALADLEEAARANVDRARQIERRARRLRRRLEEGHDLVELVEQEPAPLMVELLSANMNTLETAGAAFRAAEAIALREQGLTVEAIAKLFGVTRQRISALLKQKSAQQL